MRSLHRIAVDEFLARAIPSTPGLVGLHIGSGVAPRGNYRPPSGQHWIDADLIGGHVRANFHAIPFRSKTFDVVRCTEAIYHTVHIRAVIAELGRVLKYGGRLVLTAPLMFGPINPDDMSRYTEAGWRALLPFQSVSVTPLGGRWSLLVSLLEHSSRAFCALRPLARLDNGTCPMAYGIVAE